MPRVVRPLYVQVLIGTGLGIALGHFSPLYGATFKPLGDAFVALIRMMIAPIVFCTIVGGIGSLHAQSNVARVIVKALALFYLLTAAALLVGLAAAFVIRPGMGMHVEASRLDTSVLAPYATQAAVHGLVAFALHLIPPTLTAAFVQGHVLPVLLVAVLFGFALRMTGQAGEPVRQFVDGLAQVCFGILSMIMRLAPLGAFGAIAYAVAHLGIRSVGSLGMLIVSLYLGCFAFVAIVLGFLARLCGFSLWRLIRYLRDEIVIVLATSSTEPVLPRLVVKLERLGCDKGIVGLVLPAGYSFNLDGTAIYLSLATMFIANACDVPLSAWQIAVMLGVMLLTSKGAAGVSGSGLVALIATLSVVPDLPLAGVVLLVGIDRFMSEARALTSVISNACAVVAVSVWERPSERARLARALRAAPARGDSTPDALDVRP
ncbi:C4-dicarboxylate transport protein [Trinickia caryophylli]|nr:C4-dicarboxylate transport protein [Trinickia caryophylli]